MDAKQNEQEISFFDIPPEIRQYIYEHALHYKDPIHFRMDRGPVLEPALLATCHLVRKEALQIFYSQNTFYASTDSVAQVALTGISKDKLPLFTAIRPFGTHNIHRIPCTSWLHSIRSRWAELFRVNACSLIRRSALLVPLLGKDCVIWTTFDQLDDYVIVPNEYTGYFARGAETIE